jgi:hypothetical protein
MNLLTTLLEIFIDVVFVCAIAFGLFWWFALYRLKQIKQQLDETLKELESEQLIALTVEIDQNQYLCYNAVTKAFVCQGHNLKEIIERFKQRYPDKTAAIYNGDETAVNTLKQQWKNLNENNNSIESPS